MEGARMPNLSRKTTINFSDLKKKWPSSLVARELTGEFSGGTLNPKTMANFDSLGQGPPRFRIGRKVVYPVDGLISWMEGRATACER
jgi:hypothetical protein